MHCACLTSPIKTSHAHALTLVEILLAISIIALLVGILTPSLSSARSIALSTRCISNLKSNGELIVAYSVVHDDNVASVIRDHDYYWNRGEPLGWDIETALWARVVGGPRSTWQCPKKNFPYVGNARSLGLDNRRTIVNGLNHIVGPRLWHDTARLVVAYDATDDQMISPHGFWTGSQGTIADWPHIGDVSDEANGKWPRNKSSNYIAFSPGGGGPHANQGFGVLFADGHAKAGLFSDGAEAVFWSGVRWWSDEIQSPKRK